jgi:sensor histidine kinase YesM
MVPPPPAQTSAFARLFAWRRVKPVLIACLVMSVFTLHFSTPYLIVLLRWLFAGMCLLLVFGVIERWPRRLPRWIARWALQVIGVAVVTPFVFSIAYALTTWDDTKPWYRDKDRMGGYGTMTVLTLLVAPWMATVALLRQIRGEAERQALAFELERSEYERKASDARLRLLQAQVEPHFLFNTLANVRELVESGSPQAATVLASLIAYLRAAVPRLHDASTTLGQELELVRAYLEVMHMRMPDRLQFTVQADPASEALACPSTILLTLVENAVRHGIDPSELGGRIDVRARVASGRCVAQVIDTGVGMRGSSEGLGTGLSNLRERLQLAFAGDAALRVAANVPRGVCAEIEFPARPVSG